MKSKERELPKLSETTRRLMDYTLSALLPLWMKNLARNMPKILEGKSTTELPKHKGEPAIIIAAGPSLWRRKHLSLIAKSSWQHPIIICDRLLISCLKNNVFPSYVCSLDGHPEVATFYATDTEKLKAVFSIMVHPEVIETFKGDVYWFVPFMDNVYDADSLTRAFHFMTDKPMLMTGANVGVFAWNLAFYLECNPIIMTGFDLSYDTPDITKSLYYQQMLKTFKGNKEKTKKLFAMGVHPIFKTKYVLDPIMRGYLDVFRAYAKTAHERNKLHTINATEGGSVFGEGITCMTLQDAINKYR